LCACLASEPVPSRLLLKDPATSLPAADDPELRDPITAAQLVQEAASLRADAGADRGGGGSTCTGSVRVVIREQMDPRHREETHQVVLDILAAADPRADDPPNWPHYAEIWPHVSALALESARGSAGSCWRWCATGDDPATGPLAASWRDG
jgi:hypothetical protein